MAPPADNYLAIDNKPPHPKLPNPYPNNQFLVLSPEFRPPPAKTSLDIDNKSPLPQPQNPYPNNQFLVLSPEVRPAIKLQGPAFSTPREDVVEANPYLHMHKREDSLKTGWGLEHPAAATHSSGNEGYDCGAQTSEVNSAQHPQSSRLPHNSLPNHQGQAQSNSQVQRTDSLQQTLMQELRTQNSSQQDLITELKIRVAVLENDLKHTKQGKEDAVNASVMIAQTLGSAFSPNAGTSRGAVDVEGRPPVDSELEKVRMQCQILRLENQMLMNQRQNSGDPAWGVGGCAYSYDDLREDEVAEHDESLKWGRRLEPKVLKHTSRYFELDEGEGIGKAKGKGKGKGKEKAVDAEFGASKQAADPAGRQRVREGGLRGAYEKDKAAAAAATVQTNSLCPTNTAGTALDSLLSDYGWGISLDSDITTVPNSPILGTDSRQSGQSSDFSQRPRSMDDVGIDSLDDILNSNMDGLPIVPGHRAANFTPPPQPQDLSAINEEEEEEEEEEIYEPLETQIKVQLAAMAHISNLPAPSVLKTGFILERSFRGDDYDYKNPNPKQSHHIGGMSNFDRFNTHATLANQLHGVWSSREEREAAIEMHQRFTGRSDMRFPEMFRHGIQYVPAETDSNYLRTVHIGNLPRAVELRDVLARIRGGEIISATLLQTVKLTGSMSALVVFINEGAAADYVDYAALHPIVFDDEGEAREASLTLINTPTYPMASGLKSRIYREPKNTRCLLLPHFPDHLSLRALESDVSYGNKFRLEPLVEMWVDEYNTLQLQFCSILAAASAFGVLNNWTIYRGLQVFFGPDPCSGPLEELQLPIPPRPPMFPRNRVTSSSGEEGAEQDSGPETLRGPSFDSLNSQTETVGGGIITEQRKRLAALSNQTVRIPSFRGSGINSSSWADEVIEEAESSSTTHISDPLVESIPNYDTAHISDEPHSAVPPNSPIHGHISNNKETPSIDAIMAETFHFVTKDYPTLLQEEGRRPPTGLAGSKYASLVPSFEDGNRTHRHVRNRHMVRPARDALREEGADGWTSQEGGTVSMDDNTPGMCKMSSLTQPQIQPTPRTSHTRTRSKGSPQSRWHQCTQTPLLDNFDGHATPRIKPQDLSLTPSELELSPKPEPGPDLGISEEDNLYLPSCPEQDFTPFVQNSFLHIPAPSTPQNAEQNEEVKQQEDEEQEREEREAAERELLENQDTQSAFHPQADEHCPDYFSTNDQAHWLHHLSPSSKIAFSSLVMDQHHNPDLDNKEVSSSLLQQTPHNTISALMPRRHSPHADMDADRGVPVARDNPDHSTIIQGGAKLEDPFIVQGDGRNGNLPMGRVLDVTEKMNPDEISLGAEW